MEDNDLKKMFFGAAKKAWSTRDPKECHARGFAQTKCSEKIQECHSVSKKLTLSKIARNQKVVMLDFDNLNELGINQPDYRFRMKEVGLNDCLTFPGFCNFHDNELFKAFETGKTRLSSEALAALAFRSICYESWCQQNGASRLTVTADHIKASRPEFSGLVDVIYSNDLRRYSKIKLRSWETMAIVRSAIFSGDDGVLSHCIIRFPGVPPIVGAGAYWPSYSLDGIPIHQDTKYNCSQELARTRLVMVSTHIDISGFCIVFSWLRQGPKINVPQLFFKDLEQRPAGDRRDLFFHWLLWQVGRIAISPAWFDQRSNEFKNAILEILSKGRFSAAPPPVPLGFGLHFSEIDSVEFVNL